jgi:hypothetical protein
MKIYKNYVFRGKEQRVECQIKAHSGKRKLGPNNDYGFPKYTSFLVNSEMSHDDDFEELGAFMLSNLDKIKSKNNIFHNGWIVSMNDSERQRFDELLADIKKRKESESQKKIVETK